MPNGKKDQLSFPGVLPETNIPPVTFTPLQIDVDKLELERKLKTEEWDRRIKEFNIQTFNEFKNLKIINNPNTKFGFKDQDELEFHAKIAKSFISPIVGRLAGGQPQQLDPEEIEKFQKNLKLYEEWKAFTIKKNKERFSTLPEELQKIELANGGVWGENFGLSTFLSSMTDAVAFGIPDTDHPIYGRRFKEPHGKADFAGTTIGTIISFIGISSIGAGIKLPAALFRIAKGSDTAGRIMRTMGQPAYQLGKAIVTKGVILKFSNKFGKFPGIPGAAATSVFTGMVTSVQDTLNTLVQKYKQEDKLTTAEYIKSIPKPLFEGFWRGWGLSVINAPNAWGARFVGDSIFSSAQQGWRILTGQQDGWNNQDFVRDWIIGHAIGEFQGWLFGPNKAQRNLALKSTVIRENIEELKLLPSFRGIPVTEKQRTVLATMAATQEFIARENGQIVNDAARTRILNNLSVPFKDLFDIIITTEIPQAKTIKLQDARLNPLNADRSYRIFQKYFGWNDIQVERAKGDNALGDIKKLIPLLDKKQIVKSKDPKSITEDSVEPTTQRDFIDRLNRIVDGYKREFEDHITGKKKLPDKRLSDIERLKDIEVDKIFLRYNDFVKAQPQRKDAPLSSEQFKQSENFRQLSFHVLEKNRETIIDSFKGVSRLEAENLFNKISQRIQDRSDEFLFEVSSGQRLSSPEGPIKPAGYVSLVRRSVFEQFVTDKEVVKPEGKPTPKKPARGIFDIQEIRKNIQTKKRYDPSTAIPEYSILAEIANSSPAGFTRVIGKYLADIEKYPLSDIVKIMAKLGFDRTPGQIRSLNITLDKKLSKDAIARLIQKPGD